MDFMNNPDYYTNLYKASQIIILGMLTVFTALTFFAVLIWTITTIDEKYNKFKIKNYSKKVEAMKVDPDESDEIIAVIAAAAYEMVKKPVKISKIKFLNEISTTGGAWASSGRSSLMSSHNRN